LRKQIAHLHIPPPKGLFLQGDSDAYPAYDHPTCSFQTDAQLYLDEDSQCRCGELYNSHRDSKWIKGTLFTDTRAIQIFVETQTCMRCNQEGVSKGWMGLGGRIGPDGSRFGIFNDTNNYLYSHELFNEYTIFMATSEQTLSGFCTQKALKYARTKSPMEFVDEKTFSKVRQYLSFDNSYFVDGSFRHGSPFVLSKT
jgi:hypothetical protein